MATTNATIMKMDQTELSRAQADTCRALPECTRVLLDWKLRGEGIPIKPDNFFKHGRLYWHRKLILKPNDRKLRVGEWRVPRSKATDASHPGKSSGRTEWIPLFTPPLHRRPDGRQKMNRTLRTHLPLLSDESVQIFFVHTSRGQTLDKPFVSQSLIELLKDNLATCAQRDSAHRDL